MNRKRPLFDYQLYLFDFDGLLVNTEKIHFEAYRKMTGNRGVKLPWSFSEYCEVAHSDAESLQTTLYAQFPQLYEQEPNWQILYQEKKEALSALLDQRPATLMPGAEKLLQVLNAASIVCCVVTNSSEEQIRIIREQNPVLSIIPFWFTRESYTHPKPHPECYLTAIERVGISGEHAIGFEDTPRGIRALLQTGAQPVLVTDVYYPEIPQFIDDGVVLTSSLEAWLQDVSGGPKGF